MKTGEGEQMGGAAIAENLHGFAVESAPVTGDEGFQEWCGPGRGKRQPVDALPQGGDGRFRPREGWQDGCVVEGAEHAAQQEGAENAGPMLPADGKAGCDAQEKAAGRKDSGASDERTYRYPGAEKEGDGLDVSCSNHSYVWIFY